VKFTEGQLTRLAELGVEPADAEYTATGERDAAFEELRREAESRHRETLRRAARGSPTPMRRMEEELGGRLVEAGFMEVTTPVLLARGNLERMGITPDDPMYSQVFWADADRCLRPMQAPNLYVLLSHLGRTIPPPVRIFEVGPCFRREGTGAEHLAEFTMLNLVEMGPEVKGQSRVRELARLVLPEDGLEFKDVESSVYGDTTDVLIHGIEVASGAWGPHRLDAAWGVREPWAGLGVGLERLALARRGRGSIGPHGRSLAYQHGVRLDIQ
jgi:pyrrolysyl-tRNA synthetase-like protein